jgi:hypothetical protein
MAKRKSISKSIRFEVFKRDSFTCQYCGHKAPDVLLVIDHIQPVSKGGTNDILNLITSCKDCNSGKSNKQLNDTTVIDKQRQQLEELQERKEQIEMMFEWQKGLLDLDDQVIAQLSNYWFEQVSGFHLTDSGIKSLKNLKRKYEIDEIMTAMKISVEQYLRFEDGSPTKESVELAWSKIGGICNNRRRAKEKPHLQKLFYIRGILRNRLSYFDPHRGMRLLEDAFDAGASLDSLEKFAKDAHNWSQWRDGMEEFIEQNRLRPENDLTSEEP